jgi:hypothetical protein
LFLSAIFSSLTNIPIIVKFPSPDFLKYSK